MEDESLVVKSSRFIKLASLVLCYLFFTAGPSSALFGSECKKPKATYQKYQQEYSRQLKAEKISLARYEAKRESEYRECLKNPKAFLTAREFNLGKKDKDGCYLFKALGVGFSYPVSGRKSVDAYRDSMLIIKSYKNCFEPSQYINATQWLKNNNK
jgi:hypothetical protein